jgi:hypothetical protein
MKNYQYQRVPYYISNLVLKVPFVDMTKKHLTDNLLTNSVSLKNLSHGWMTNIPQHVVQHGQHVVQHDYHVTQHGKYIAQHVAPHG